MEFCKVIEHFKYSESEIDELLKSLVVLIDTREKECTHITNYFDNKKITYKRKSLDYGDYSYFLPANPNLSIPRDIYFDNLIVIERKASLEELSGNFSQNRDRFEKELSLCPAKKILLIENSKYSDVVDGKYDTQYNKKSFLGSLHSFWFKYHLPFEFMPDHNYSPVFIYGTFYYHLRNFLR
jgi:ERCC4-type nuclease